MRDLIDRALNRYDEEADSRRTADEELVCLDALGGVTVCCPAGSLDVVDAEAADDETVVDVDIAVTGDAWIAAEPDLVTELQEVR